MATPSKRIGKYEIIDRLGSGAMGTTYLARDPVVDRAVVVKVFSRGDGTLRDGLTRAARAASRLTHPNIATILEVGEHDGQPFIVTEYIEGETLAEIIRRRSPLSLQRKIQIVEDVSAALDYAHRNGMIHRDITPSQIMVTSDGIAKVLDFGTVHAAATQITQAGMILGTLNYLSPEQLKGTPVDGRSDVFALGAVLYEFITYQKAFPGDIATGVLHHIIADEPAPATSLVPVLPQELERIIEHSLKKDPAQRYTDAGLMRRDLSRVRTRLDASEEIDAPTMLSPAPSLPVPSPKRFDRESIARLRASQIGEHLAEAREFFDQRRFEESIAACEMVLVLDADDHSALELIQRAHTAMAERHAEEEFRRRAESEARKVVEQPKPEIVPVFYATDRARSGPTTDSVTYGSERSPSGLAYGSTFVSIPPGHRRGHLERPSILKLEFREHPDRHVVALKVTEYTKTMFFDLLRKAIAGPEETTTFVFIHGFNVDFDEAVRRTAQLGFDLGLSQAPILYSWPSQGSALQYIADTNAAMWTVPHLAEFLRDLQVHSGATSIHLVAHSMGNQALTGALRLLRADASLQLRLFKQVVLTAPDLDAHVFERDLAPQIVGIGERTTLYASSRDEVLTISKRLNAYRRAGDAADGIVVVEGVDSIDASQVSTGLGHSAYGDVRTVVEDLSLLLRLGLAPGKRNLVARGVPPKQHWVFPA